MFWCRRGQRTVFFDVKFIHEYRSSRGEKMEKNCKECGGSNLREDEEKAECVCFDCGFVMPLSQNDEFNNGGSLFGDERTHERVSSNADLGGTFQPSQSRVDHTGRAVNRQLRRAYIFGTQRTQVRERNPQLRQVKEAVVDLVGEDTMFRIERIIDACIIPFSEEDLQTIKQHQQKSGRREKNLKNVAQSTNRISKDFFQRQGDENGSTAGRLNNYLLAMAILEWCSLLGLIQRVDLANRRQALDLPLELVTKARLIVDKCLKAQIRLGLRCNGLRYIAERNVVEIRVTNRDEDFTQALNDLLDALFDAGISDEVLDSINNDVQRRMNLLKEPSIDGPLTNHPAKKIMAMLVYFSLEAHVGRHRNLTMLADTILMTAQGLANFISLVESDRKLLPEAFIEAILPNLSESSCSDGQDSTEAVDN